MTRGLSASPSSRQRVLDRLALARGVRMRDVDDVQQHRRVGQLLQRRAERRDELRRQLLDEADGVGQQRRVQVVELDRAASAGRASRRADSATKTSASRVSARISVLLPAFV